MNIARPMSAHCKKWCTCCCRCSSVICPPFLHSEGSDEDLSSISAAESCICMGIIASALSYLAPLLSHYFLHPALPDGFELWIITLKKQKVRAANRQKDICGTRSHEQQFGYEHKCTPCSGSPQMVEGGVAGDNLGSSGAWSNN